MSFRIQILYNINKLKRVRLPLYLGGIVEHFGRRVQMEVLHRRDVRFLPTTSVFVVRYFQHVVRKNSAELNLGATLKNFGDVVVEFRRFAHCDVDVRFRELYTKRNNTE